MSVAQFRHGFVEAADKNIRLVIIGTQSATWEIDHQFGLDLKRMGAMVNWIGPLPAGSPMETWASWPRTVPKRFASLFEIVPLQMLAYRTAEARGIVPGTFRWASTVTASETGFPLLER
jgi:fructoselysine-6-P-deglycase FrlB-like protein